MGNIQAFKCPNCGGKLEFDAATQKMKCPFCESRFDPESLQQNEGQAAQPVESDRRLEETEAESLQSYVCKSCGGEIITEKTTAATHCPYCGNPVVMTDRVGGALRPDAVIPFKITKQQAVDTMKSYVKAKRYAPRLFSSENQLKEIKGIYVPYWLFDSLVDAEVSFQATQTRHWSDKSYDYTETSFYEMERSGKMRFACVPVDGSRKMTDDLMDSLEPFDFSGAVDFNTAFLSGFFADKYDVDAQECRTHAHDRMKNRASAELAGTVPAKYSITSQRSNIQVLPDKTTYALFPVWLLRTQYRNRTYTFAMNGQTGAFIGEVPISKKKLGWLFGGVSAAVSAGVFVAGLLIGLF